MPIYKKIENSIAIYGIGLEGEKFFYNYSDKFKIAYAIDRRNDKYNFHGIKVYHIDYIIKNMPRVFIVVTCQLEIYKEIASILVGYGLVEFKDFIWHEYIERELVILYGNCHMGAIETYLKNNIYFNRRYIIKRICVTEEQPRKVDLEASSILITQDINEQNKLGVVSSKDLCRAVSDDCVKILVPNLFGYNLFFPQIYESEEWKQHLTDDGNDSEEYKTAVRRIGIADENIRRYWSDGKSIDYIVDAIKNKDIYPAERIIENFEKQMARIREREKKCDIKISDYIESNYKDKKLFFEPGHLSDAVLYEMGGRICDLLHIQRKEEFLPPIRLDTNELFIYGCVCKALGLRFQQEYVRRSDCSATIYNRPIDLKEYVRQSILWLYNKK